MAAYASELKVFPVQEEPFVRVDMIISQSERLLHLVYKFPAGPQRDLCPVYERVFRPVPQVRVRNFE